MSCCSFSCFSCSSLYFWLWSTLRVADAAEASLRFLWICGGVTMAALRLCFSDGMEEEAWCAWLFCIVDCSWPVGVRLLLSWATPPWACF